MMKRKHYALLLILSCIVLFVAIHLLQGTSPFTPSPYNTYTLQAMQWRQGKAALAQDVPHLELAIYKGQYFVSFPSVPTVPIFFMTFLFGDRVPDTLLLIAYALGACLALYAFLSRRMVPGKAALWAFLACFASSLLPLLQNGAVWYQAQVLAFLLTVLAIERMDADKPTLGLFLYALAVGCRPFNVLYGPVLMLLYLWKHPGFARTLRRKMPGIALGLLVAALYAWYNFIRFDNPFEFGHNHLPEFSFQGGIQFSLRHIPGNARTFVWGLPFIDTLDWQLKTFGFSMFLANPLLACMVLWLLASLCSKRMTWQKGLLFVGFALHATLLLCHRTGGGFQFGARYWADCLPWTFLWMGLERTDKASRAGRIIQGVSLVMLIAGLAFAVYGATVIHL